MLSSHRLSKPRQAPVAPSAPFKPLPRMEIKRGRDIIPLDKLASFLQHMNSLIDAYNALAGGAVLSPIKEEDEAESKEVVPEIPSFESTMASQERILRQLQENFTKFNDEFPEEHLQASPNYRVCYDEWTDEINLRLLGLHKPGLAPAASSLASIIATMSTAKAKELMFILLRNTELIPEARLRDELRAFYPADDRSREAESFRLFFSTHTISYLGGVNSRNFQVGNHYGQLEVLKVGNLFGQPRKVERRLQQQLGSELVPIAAERLVIGTNPDGRILTRVLMATAYCGGSLADLQASQALPDERLATACEKIEQMATLFLKLQAHGFMFPDAKLSNWLVNSHGQLCIADTKSIVFADADGNYSSKIEGNQYRSLVHSHYYSPPELVTARRAKADEVHAFQLGSNLYAYLTSYEALRSAMISGALDFNDPIFASSQGRALASLIKRLMVVEPHRRLSVEGAYRELHEITHSRETLLLEQIAQKLGAGEADLVMKAILPVIKADLACAPPSERERQLDVLDDTLREMGPASLSSILASFQSLKCGSSDVAFDAFIQMTLAYASSVDRRVKLVSDLARILQPLKQDKPGLQELLYDLELHRMGEGDMLMAAFLDEKKRQLETATLEARVECILELRHLLHDVLPDLNDMRRIIATLDAYRGKADALQVIETINQGSFLDRKLILQELQDILPEISPDARELDREKACFESLDKWMLDSQDEGMKQWISQQQQVLHQCSLPDYLGHLHRLERDTEALLSSLKVQKFVFDALAVLPVNAFTQAIKNRLLDLPSPHDRAVIINDLKAEVIEQLRQQEEILLFEKLQGLVMAKADPLMQTYIADCRTSLMELSLAGTMEEYSGAFLALSEKIKELTLLPVFSVRKLFNNLNSMKLSAEDPVVERWMAEQHRVLLGLPVEERIKRFRELSLLASTGIDTQFLLRRVIEGFTACAIGDDEQMNFFILSKQAQLLATPPEQRRDAVLALRDELYALQADPGMLEVQRIINDYRHKAGGRVDSGKGRKAINIERALQQVPIEERQHFFQSRSPACLAVMEAMALRRGRGFFSDKVPRTARGEIDVGKAPKPFQAFMRVKESHHPKDDAEPEAPKGRKSGLKS